MKLVLFDVDGTLINIGANQTHHDAFTHALDKVFQIKVSLDVIHFQGKIDSQIIIEVLEYYGIDRKDSLPRLDEVYKIMVDYYKANVSKLHEHVLPNVRECLEELSKRDDVIVGLLTGNVEEIAWEKMSQAGLRDYFQMGAFGNEALKRADLVTVALTKTRTHDTNEKDTYVIGDTPLDIDCAKESGCKSIAVASGLFSLGELEKNDPDFLTENILDVVGIVSGEVTT